MSWHPPVYRCDIDPQWIDYNGHLRDAQAPPPALGSRQIQLIRR
jgi:hypothetical protein